MENDQELTIKEAYQRIMALYPSLDYNHRKYLAPGFEKHPDYEEHISEEFRVRYVCFKAAVAAVIRPDSILEIGVRGGVSALAFLHALDDTNYLGIDNNLDAIQSGIDFRWNAEHWFRHFGFKARVFLQDSQLLESFPSCVLAHIDGDHSYEAVRHDVAAAWKGGSQWILCDDANDSAVVAGIFHALKFDLNRGSVDWVYFHDTWKGDILIRTDHRRDK